MDISTLIPLYNNKGDIQSYNNYRVSSYLVIPWLGKGDKEDDEERGAYIVESILVRPGATDDWRLLLAPKSSEIL